MSKFFRLAAAVAAAWISPCLALAQGAPYSDSGRVFALASDTELTIMEEELRPQMVMGPFEPTQEQVLIEAQPSHGSLEAHMVGNDRAWKYTPNNGFFGRDTFEYRIGDRLFQAYLSVSPARFPISGRWPTQDCYRDKEDPQSACPNTIDTGHGSELGWYDTIDHSFVLCDWQGRFATECVRVEIPVDRAFGIRTPLVVDRDGDGWHELALRDPLTGLTEVFQIVPSAEGNKPERLTRVDSWRVGQPGDLPVAGHWLGGTASDLGVYQYQHGDSGFYGQLLLESTDEHFLNDLGTDIERAWPLVGDWVSAGQDHVGLFDLQTRTLWHKPALGGMVHSTSAEGRGHQETIPVSVKIGAFVGESVLALFDPRQGYGKFHFLRVDGNSVLDPLPLEVVVDPTGGPWPPPDR